MTDHEYRITLCTDEPLTTKDKKIIAALLLAFDWSFSADRIGKVYKGPNAGLERAVDEFQRHGKC